MEWSNEKYLDFIEEYRKNEVLWDVRNSNYKNNRIKRDALLGLARKYDLVEAHIKKKIKNLRSAFHREHNRIINRKSGSGFTNDNKKWFAYDSLKFILDVTEPREGTSSTINDDVTSNPKNTDSDTRADENTDANMLTPTGPSRPTSQGGAAVDRSRKNRKRPSNLVSQTENEKRAEEAYHILKKSASNDDHSIYGQHVANELRKLSPISQTYVKHKIGNVLFKAALGMYDNQQIVTNRSQISSPETPAVAIPSPSSSDFSLDNNIELQSTCDDQYLQSISETFPASIENPDVPKESNQDSNNDSHSVLVEYLDQSSDQQ